MNVRENLTLAVHRGLRRFRAFLSRKKEEELNATYVTSLRIRIATQEQVVNTCPAQPAEVVIAKWLATCRGS